MPGKQRHPGLRLPGGRGDLAAGGGAAGGVGVTAKEGGCPAIMRFCNDGFKKYSRDSRYGVLQII